MNNAPNDTSRQYPRTLRDAFPALYRECSIGIAGPAVIPTKPPMWVRVLRAADQWLVIYGAEYRFNRIEGKGGFRSMFNALRKACEPTAF